MSLNAAGSKSRSQLADVSSFFFTEKRKERSLWPLSCQWCSGHALCRPPALHSPALKISASPTENSISRGQAQASPAAPPRLLPLAGCRSWNCTGTLSGSRILLSHVQLAPSSAMGVLLSISRCPKCRAAAHGAWGSEAFGPGLQLEVSRARSFGC